MKTITLRDVPDQIAARIVERARRTGASLNRTVIEMLIEREASATARTHHDLDHLAGALTNDDAVELEREVAAQRAIDPDMWR